MSRGRPGVVVATVLALGLLVGALAGVVWEWWWTPPRGVALREEFVFTPAGLTEGFSGTGLYVVVAAAAGLLLGVVVALRGDGRELVAVLTLVPASALGGWVMGVVGPALGPPDPAVRARTLADYAPLVQDLEVEGAAAWLTLPAAALLGAALVFLVLTRKGHHGDHPQG